MKKYFSSMTYLLILFFVISCSDDPSNPTVSDLDGMWNGETIIGNDTARYGCIITEANKAIKGTGELYGYHKTTYSNMTITDESRRFANVVGNFDRPNIGIKFDGDLDNHFEGQLSEDKLSMNGKVKIRFTMIELFIEYPIILTKTGNIVIK